jgi:membrane-associated phospholipid phosphatase
MARFFVVLLLLACAAAALTGLASTGRLVPGEITFAQAVQDTPRGDAIEEAADVLASPIIEYALIAGLAVAAARHRDYALAATALVVLGCMALNLAIKDVVRRDRPTTADVIVREHAGGFGFPSGHVQSATLVYGYAAIGAARLAPRMAGLAIAAAMVAVAAIAFDRVYNGAHWPSDVAGGALIGLLLLIAAVRLPRAVARRVERSTPGKIDFG